MNSPLTFTPCRSLDFNADEVKSLMTPEVKKDLRQLFDDEDSGLGMDDKMLAPENGRSDELSFNLTAILNLTDFSKEKLQIRNNNLHQQGSSSKRSLFTGKRQRDEDDDSPTPSSKLQRRGEAVFRRTLSFGDWSMTSPEIRANDVKAVVNRLVEDEDLVGDGTDTFCLPTIKGRHQDLKSISANTMVNVLTGRYDDVIGSYHVIDCRYPYEFNGGHMKHAENKYTRDQVQQLLQERRCYDVTGKRNILIFHCEFSSERGPKFMRFLRTQDRAQNEANYPTLTYPEVYLLDGGYKAFYHTDKTLCHPMEYKPMLHQGHSDELRHFRARSKSWTAGDKQKKTASRLRF
ncbi:M-phase inducer phosphatase-like [Mizuhopecten yessoensis]|uniref:M-phase inducer phosphatase-like n=1 Tax=Mizuhopecten yessoensis TaxID=6573 RepID=UPI000B45A6B6|nr:M-phase inducer phosphatase-like [Mizuhopecten yessoensis]XP_021372967.1 M-phase inducer phosphatase-like [Mizuhopecten yessoensis]